MWLHGLIALSDYKETPMSFYDPPTHFFHNPSVHLPKNHLENISVE
jgi:hypothetical protein